MANKIEIYISDEMFKYLGKDRKDLADFVVVDGFKMLNGEVKIAVLDKLRREL